MARLSIRREFTLFPRLDKTFDEVAKEEAAKALVDFAEMAVDPSRPIRVGYAMRENEDNVTVWLRVWAYHPIRIPWDKIIIWLLSFIISYWFVFH